MSKEPRNLSRETLQRRQLEDLVEERTQALSISEEKYRGLFDDSLAAVYVFDGQKHFIDSNKAGLELLGYSREELLKLSIEDVDADPVAVVSAHDELASGGRLAGFEHQLKRKDGRIITVLNNSCPLTDAQGNVIGLQSTLMDITERKRVELELKHHREHLEDLVAERTAELRESEDRFRLLLMNVPTLAVQGYRADGVVKYWNHASESVYGYTKSEAIGKNILDLIIPDEKRETVHQNIVKYLVTGEVPPPEEMSLVRKDGSIVSVLSSKAVVQRPGLEPELFNMDMDITENKRAEADFLREKAISDVAIESHPGVFYLYNDMAKSLRWNQNLETVSGYSSAEIENMRPEDFFLSDQRSDLNKAIKKVFETGFGSVEAVLLSKEGVKTPYYLTGARLEIEGVPCFVGVGIDITGRKQAEEEKRNLERQILHSQKLESLGILAGGIAHDFNNILASILGNTDLALAGLSKDSSAQPFLEEIDDATRRASDLTQQMLAYSGRGSFVIAPLDLSKAVDEMVHLLKSSISKKAILTTDLHDNLPSIEGDATQLQQVIMNLMINASEAIGEDSLGSITISTSAIVCSRDYLKNSCLDQKPSAGEYVLLEVSDTGCGMNDETISKLFDPFFTTKLAGRGLGMSAVLGIVGGHQGAIMIESEVGQGTTFRVLFPAMEKKAATPLINDKQKELFQWQGNGTVLIVDDDAGILRFVTRVINGMGLETLQAKDGQEGVEVFREHADTISCVLLDLTMPRRNGWESFQEMRKIRDDVPVVLSSGFDEAELSKRFGRRGLAGFISKPYKISQLEKILRSVLDPGE